MAPIAETFPNGYPSKTMITTLNPYNKTPTIKPKEMSEKTSQKKNSFRRPQKLSVEGLQRAVSDLSLELSREPIEEMKLPTISEVENAVCECCGLSEEYTTDYMKQVRERFCGKWVCGLCAEAVKEELQRLGEVSPTKKEEVSFTKEKVEEALSVHMAVCVRFSRIGRTNPALFLADGMREILKRGQRTKSNSPRDRQQGKRSGGITRSTSCIPVIARERNNDSSGGHDCV